MKFSQLSQEDIWSVTRDDEDPMMGTLELYDGEYRYCHSPTRGNIKSLSPTDLDEIVAKARALA